MQPLSLEKRRVVFTIPQYRAMRVAMRYAGVRESHKVDVDFWEAQSLYEAAVALPWKSTREFKMRESILAKLGWAKPEAKTRTLAEVLS